MVDDGSLHRRTSSSRWFGGVFMFRSIYGIAAVGMVSVAVIGVLGANEVRPEANGAVASLQVISRPGTYYLW